MIFLVAVPPFPLQPLLLDVIKSIFTLVTEESVAADVPPFWGDVSRFVQI